MRRRRVLTAAGVALAAGAAVVLVAALRPAPMEAPSRVPTDAAARNAFETALSGDGAAGVAAWLVTHPSPASLRSATRLTTVEVSGTGSRTAVLDPPDVGDGAGRATVLLVTGLTTDASWTLRADRDLASRGGVQRVGDLTAATIRYADGDRPTRLAVSVPDGVRWGAAVVYSD